jgi:hypothetical protein
VVDSISSAAEFLRREILHFLFVDLALPAL